MDVEIFNPHSRRAQRARMAHALAPWVLAIDLSAVLLALLGIGLLALSIPVGWALIGFAVIPAMIGEWHRYGLSHLPPVKDGARVDEILDSEILGLLPVQPSPQEIALALSKTTAGLFFTGRFGIGGGFLAQVSSTSREDSAAVWQEAIQIAKQFGGTASAGVLILALLRQLPNKETLLGHLQLEEQDLIRGIRWYARLADMIELTQRRKKQPGGIGRDWSFGWIPQLSRHGHNISLNQTIASPARSEVLKQLAQTVASSGTSVALVGQNGVGKTEIVQALASRLMDPLAEVPEKLRYNQIFMLDTVQLLSAASERGALESLVEQLLVEAHRAKNIILFFDNAQLFFEDGVGAVDISSVLVPVLQAGRLPIILAMDEQRYLQISKRNPGLVGAVTRMNIAPTNEEDTIAILQDHVPALEYRRKVTYMHQALVEARKLSVRYVYDMAMPGQAISLLETAAEYAESGLVTSTSVNRAIEKTIGVKTNVVDDETERQTLLNLEELIHERMIGQERAVSVVSDALRRARSGVRNQKRPVGTFLFLGPTGVGKTELAKSLASVYFGGEDNIIRLDMNEFVEARDVSRLIADGTEDPNSLTARVMKQPFSVVLLDEIEKAHSSVLTTLLQLLDEGILRDERNREVSFRDTIVIATSNAGSDRIQEYLHRGYDLAQFESAFVDELLGSNVFHPEFLNRFDEIVVFGPLSKKELLKVVDLILAEVNRNLADQKVSVAVNDDAKEFLVEAGYDPRLGARPMRRVVQRAVENTVAKAVLGREAGVGDTVTITLEQVTAILQKKKGADLIAEDSKK